MRLAAPGTRFEHTRQCGNLPCSLAHPTPAQPTAGKYVTGDINEAYMRNLEEQGRGRGRARPGRKASLLRGSPASNNAVLGKAPATAA